jgi:hypothetical protein
LRTLCIQGCRIGNAGATALADMLVQNRVLVNIDYSDNDMGTEGYNKLFNTWNSTRSIEKHRMIVTGGKFSMQSPQIDISEDEHKNTTAPSAMAKSTAPKSQFEWAKEQLRAAQAKQRIRRR